MFAWFWAVLYMHISMSNVTLSVLCYCTRACVITFLPVFPWRVTIIPKVQPAADNSTDEDNTLLYLQNSSYPTQPQSKHVIANYYSFKIFLHFWLAKTTYIIHHNQLLLTKIYWTNDVKSAARQKLLNQWHQNDVKSAARCRLLNRWPRKPGDKVVLYLVSGKTKSEMTKLL